MRRPERPRRRGGGGSKVERARARLRGGGAGAAGGVKARRAAVHRPQGCAHRAEMAPAGDGGGAASRDLICVTGGSGFIGSRSVRLILDRGYTVHTTVKNLDDEDFYEELAGPDLLNPASGRSAIDGARGKLW